MVISFTAGGHQHRQLVLFDTGNGGDPSSSAAVVSWQSTSYRLRWVA
jgi:hypothetical protein